MLDGSVHVSGGGGYPPGGGGPPGGGWGPPPGSPPGGGGYGPPGGPPPGGPPGGGWGPPPGGPPPGGPPGPPPGYGPPGSPGAPGIPGGPPAPQGPPPGYGPPGGPPGGLPPGYQPPGAPPPGAPGYGPPGGPPGGLPPGYVPPGQQPPPPGGGYGPPGGGGAPGGYAPPGYGPPAGGYGPPGGPGGGYGGPPPGGYGGGGFVPPGAPPTASGGSGAWSPVEALGFAWNALMKNFAGVSLPIATAVVILVVPIYGGIFALALMAGMVAEFVDPAFIGLFNALAQACIVGVGLLIGTFLAGGVTEFSLKVARGQPVAFGDVFAGGKYFGSILVGSIGFLICAAIGGLLCIIPGYIVQFGLWPFAFIIVDQKLGGIDALKKAWAMTNGHKLSIFLFWLLSVLLVIAGEIACLIGALLVSAPMLAIANAHLYLTLKGEPPRLPQ